MKPSHLMKQCTAFGLAVAIVCLVVVSAPAAPAARIIHVLSVASVDAASPKAEIWKKVPATQVTVQPAVSEHGSVVAATVTEQITVQTVRTGDRLFVKLVWSDRTANTTIKDTTDFLDGAAVQFPGNGKASTTPFMGDARNPVNVWHWRANGHAENLIAIGSGTATRAPFEGLSSAAVRAESGWEVVFTRVLQVRPDEGVNLRGRSSIPVAFAAWDGNNHERDEAEEKMVEWWQLKF